MIKGGGNPNDRQSRWAGTSELIGFKNKDFRDRQRKPHEPMCDGMIEIIKVL